MELRFARPGLAVPHFDLKIYENTATGTGSYVAEHLAPVNMANRYALTPEAPVNTTTTQNIALNNLAAAKIFKLLRSANGLTRCASSRKGIADTGAKVLTFHEGPGAEVTCSFNYSEDKPVVELTTLLQAMASVLDAGLKLERDQRFDRLALDRDVADLTTAAREGRAFGLSNIAPVLQSIATDQEVLERVRTQAGRLLEQSALQP